MADMLLEELLLLYTVILFCWQIGSLYEKRQEHFRIDTWKSIISKPFPLL